MQLNNTVRTAVKSTFTLFTLNKTKYQVASCINKIKQMALHKII
jgi:hypothetical protein